MATFRVQQRVDSLWEQVARCRSWERALGIIDTEAGADADADSPGWLIAQDNETDARIHLRCDGEWRVVETGFTRETARAAEEPRGRRYGAVTVAALLIPLGGASLPAAAAETGSDAAEWVLDLVSADEHAESRSTPYLRRAGREW